MSDGLTDITVAYPALRKDGNIPNDPDKTNWVEQAGGLPPYIRQVAEDLHSERGMSVSAAIATAINKIKQWSRGGGDTKPDTQAKATAALAQWTKMKKDAGVADVPEDALIEGVSKGLNYMEKPHRYTPGPAGMCLFCSNSQRWHTENRPKTPAEVEQEKKDRAIQEKNDDALGSALMLTPLPTEDDMLSAQAEEAKRIAQAEKIAGAPVQDPNDPKVAAGVTKAQMKAALITVLAKKMAAEGAAPTSDKKPSGKKADRPLVEVQYDPEKKAGGINEAERKKLADDGIAMEDGTFPIRDEADLKIALKFWGKATDPYETREHIIVRAVELGLEDLLPQNFKDHQSAKTSGEPAQTAEPVKKAAYAVTKSAEEKRYTLGPMYIPNRLDAHNEFATADELQKAVWDYVRAGDRQIRLQHNTDIVAGECVEVLSWPSEITTNLSLPGMGMQKSSSVTFPAGTTYMGIVWEPWAWNWVKKGKISGLSMGGFAKRVAVEFDLDDSLTKSLDAAIAKFRADQPRDEYGRWVDVPQKGNWFDRNVMGTETVMGQPKAPSVSRVSPTDIAGLISGTKPNTGPLKVISETINSNGVKITHLEHRPERSDVPETTIRSDASALALAITNAAEQAGVGLDAFLQSIARMLVHKRGGEHWRNQPRDPGGENGGRWVKGGAAGAGAPDLPNVSPGKGESRVNPSSPAPLTDAEYDAYIANLQKTLDDYAEAGGSKNPLESTNSTHLAHRADPTDPSSNYLPSRKRLHNEIVGQIIGDALSRGVPKQRKSWIAGGLPGAGKSSFIKDKEGQERLGLIPDTTTTGLSGFKNAVVINPDDIKTLMADKGMFPEIPGTDPMERVGFVHEESSEIAQALANAATDLGLNVVWDITAHSSTSVADRIGDLRDKGYNDTTYFLLDVSIEHSLASALQRHRSGLERRRSGRDGHDLEAKAEFGGRYVPAFVTKSNASKRGNRSKMRDAYEEILAGDGTSKRGRRIGKVHRVILVDNEGYQKKVLSDTTSSMSSSISG